MAKPVTVPEWNSGGANNTAPSGPKKILGWVVGEEPLSSSFNWWQKLVYEWVLYLKDGQFTTGVGGTGVLGTGSTGAETGVKGVGVTYGIRGESTAGTAVSGISTDGSAVYGYTDGNGIAVRGEATQANATAGSFTGSTSGSTGVLASGKAYGLSAVSDTGRAAKLDSTGSTLAALQLVAQAAPTTGAVGDIYVSSADQLPRICTVAGTPGTWVEMAGGGGAALISGHAEDLAPAITIGSPDPDLYPGVVLLSYTHPTSLDDAREVMLTASGTCYVGGSGTVFNYYISVNGTETTHRKLFFNSGSFHMAWTASWLVTLPAGAVTIELWGYRDSGTSTITISTDDYLSFTFQG